MLSEATVFESSWQLTIFPGSSSSLPHPVDADQAETLHQFLALVDQYLDNLSKARMDELIKLDVELETSFTPILPVTQRARLAAFLKGLQWSSEDIFDLKNQAKSYQISLQHISQSRASISNQASTCRTLKHELNDAIILEANLKRQLKDAEERMILLQK